MMVESNKVSLQKQEKIGLFGGTFDPIHSGHIRAAEAVQKNFALDKVLFIPSYIPPHKESMAVQSAGHRLKMVELAVEDNPFFIASPLEIEQEGTSYSILTLQKVKKIYPRALFFFILGIDAFLEIDTWKDYRKVLEQCCFVVISRIGYRLEDARTVLEGKYSHTMVTLLDSGKVSDDLIKSHRIFLLAFDALDIASTEVRAKLRKKQSIEGMVPGPVADFINKNKLYQ